MAPGHSQWPMNSLVCIGVPPPLGGKGLGSKLEQGEWDGSLESSWNLRKPPACSPCSQVAPLAPRGSLGPWSELGVSWSEPNVILGPRVPETFLEPQKATRSLPMLPDCSPHFQLTPLAPRAFLGLWNLPGASESPQLTPLAPSLLPLLPEHPWISGTFLEPQEAPSLLPLLQEDPWVPGVSWEWVGASQMLY